jgi:2-hydroxy-3-oxopropionate reductase
MNTPHLTIGVIGVGVMGSAIAARLLERGAQLAESGVSMARRADAVITSLNSAAIVEQAVFAPDGVAAGAAPGLRYIDMGSIDPRATADMARRLKAACGVDWVDAPLSGGAPAARSGRLTLMIGGAEDAVARARAVLGDLAANATHMGPAGAGQTTKLINQVLCACGFLAVAEATRLALDGGVDAARIPAALAGGRADSRILQEFMPKMAVFDYTPTGRIDNMLKDREAVQRTAAEQRTPMPLTALVTELHRMLLRAGCGPEDSAAYMKLFDFGRGEA